MPCRLARDGAQESRHGSELLHGAGLWGGLPRPALIPEAGPSCLRTISAGPLLSLGAGAGASLVLGQECFLPCPGVSL